MCIKPAKLRCHAGIRGDIFGGGVATRIASRTNTNANTLKPSMKCHVFKPSRRSLPLG